MLFLQKYLLYIFVGVGLVTGVLVGTYAFYTGGLKLVRIPPQNAAGLAVPPAPSSDAPQENVSLNTNTPTGLDGSRVNILFLGHGDLGHPGGSLMDSIIVVSVDTKTKKAAFVSIPRDLSFPFSDASGKVVNRKINEGFVVGGWNSMAQAAATVTGFKIENYAAVDFVQFEKLVATLGGIEANIPKTYDDYFYPIRGKELDLCGMSPQEVAEVHQKYTGFELEKQFACRYKHLHYDMGPVHMEGGPALEYVRSRHGDGDFGRSERQMVVLKAIADKAISRDVLGKSTTLLQTLLKLVKTNLDVAAIRALADYLGNPNQYRVVSVQLTDGNVLTQTRGANGAFLLVPREGLNKWNAVQNYISSKL